MQSPADATAKAWLHRAKRVERCKSLFANCNDSLPYRSFPPCKSGCGGAKPHRHAPAMPKGIKFAFHWLRQARRGGRHALRAGPAGVGALTRLRQLFDHQSSFNQGKRT
jgi:hypothetical protein